VVWRHQLQAALMRVCPRRTREAGGDEYTREPSKAADERCPRDRPVLEADDLMFWVEAEVDRGADEDEGDDGGHLERGEPVLWTRLVSPLPNSGRG
jgi:hypothetical protein